MHTHAFTQCIDASCFQVICTFSLCRATPYHIIAQRIYYGSKQNVNFALRTILALALSCDSSSFLYEIANLPRWKYVFNASQCVDKLQFGHVLYFAVVFILHGNRNIVRLLLCTESTQNEMFYMHIAGNWRHNQNADCHSVFCSFERVEKKKIRKFFKMHLRLCLCCNK